MRVFIPPRHLYQYWVLTTKGCNLKCKYCFEEEKIKGSKPSYKLEDLVRIIGLHNPYAVLGVERQSAKNGVVFTGGEPLMNQEFIKEFILKTKGGLRLEYVLQTNGTLLNKIDPYVLENLDFILVSVDGNQEIHDRNRGKGTFDTIVRNIRGIKPKYKGQIAARITATVDKDFSIFDSIMALKDDFDNFHWQLETPIAHSVTEKDRASFIERYRSDMGELVDYWISSLQNGAVKNIIPFQSVATPVRNSGLRCGAGTTLVVVDLDGECYGCDTMVGDPRARIGSIYEGFETERLSFQLAMNCSGNPLTCKDEVYKEKPGCMKGCAGCSWEESNEFYCSTVKILIDAAMSRKDFINDLLDSKKISPENVFMGRIALYTEQIP